MQTIFDPVVSVTIYKTRPNDRMTVTPNTRDLYWRFIDELDIFIEEIFATTVFLVTK